MSDLKIGFVDYNNLDAGGGTEFWLHDVARYLSTRHETVILTTTKSAHNARIKSATIANGSDITEIDVIGPSSLPTPRGWNSTVRLFNECDLIYLIFSPGGLDLAANFAGRLSGTPLIAGHHQPITWEGFDGSLSVFQRIYYVAFGFRGQRVARLINHHHVINRDACDVLRRLRFKSVEFVPYGVHTSEFTPRPKKEDFTILYMGRLTEQKGTDKLPEILTRLSSKVPAIRLIIAGTGNLEVIARTLSADSRVKWVGFADTPTRAKLLAESHVLLLPSRYEAFGLVGLEALASGTPVVSFDIPGPRDYVIPGQTGHLVQDVESMVKALVEIHDSWKNGSAYDIISQGCRRQSLQFDWQMVGPRFERLLTAWA